MKNLKNLYNITSWPKYNLNYWGIPKCANTSVKLALSNQTVQNQFATSKKIHKDVNYISQTEALNNKHINFTVIRNPYDRFISLYKDWGLRRSNRYLNFELPVKFDYFLNYILDNFSTDDTSETHFKSQSYWITSKQRLLVDKIFTIEQAQHFLSSYNLTLEISNKTKDYDIILTELQKEKIHNRYRKDFELLGFKK